MLCGKANSGGANEKVRAGTVQKNIETVKRSPRQRLGKLFVSPSKKESKRSGIIKTKYLAPNAQPPCAAPCPQRIIIEKTTAKIFILCRKDLRSGEVKNAMTEKIRTGAKKNKPRDGEKSKRKKL